MKIAFITDIHQNIEALKRINFSKFDQILCGGDILDPHKPNVEVALEIIDILPKQTYIVPGNCDKNKKVVFAMKKKLNYIHKKTIFMQNIPLLGIGYCRQMVEDIKIYRQFFMEDTERVPNFLRKSNFHVLLDFCGVSVKNNKVIFLNERETMRNSKDFLKKFEAFKEKDILKFIHKQKKIPAGTILSHSPPRGALDKMAGLPRIGSLAIRQAIKMLKPRLLLCGHFHELSGTRTVDNTLIFNPGALKDNYYGEIFISDKKVEVKIKKIGKK